MAHIAGHSQNRGPPVKLDLRSLRFDPEPGPPAIDELYFEPPGRLLILEMPRHGLAEQGPVRGFDEVYDIPAHKLRGLQPHQRSRRVVRQQDFLVVNEHDFRQRSREVAEQPVPILDHLVTLTQGVEQPIDGNGQIRHIAVAGHTQAVTDRGIARHFNQFLAEPPDSFL